MKKAYVVKTILRVRIVADSDGGMNSSKLAKLSYEVLRENFNSILSSDDSWVYSMEEDEASPYGSMPGESIFEPEDLTIAEVIKDYLCDLAVQDSLPMDLNSLNQYEIAELINETRKRR